MFSLLRFWGTKNLENLNLKIDFGFVRCRYTSPSSSLRCNRHSCSSSSSSSSAAAAAAAAAAAERRRRITLQRKRVCIDCKKRGVSLVRVGGARVSSSCPSVGRLIRLSRDRPCLQPNSDETQTATSEPHNHLWRPSRTFRPSHSLRR